MTKLGFTFYCKEFEILEFYGLIALKRIKIFGVHFSSWKMHFIFVVYLVSYLNI